MVAFLLFMIFIDLASQPHHFYKGTDYGGCDLKQVKQYLLSFLQISPIDVTSKREDSYELIIR